MHARYEYYAYLRPENLKYRFDRASILDRFAKMGIPVGTGICPEIYLEAAFSKRYHAPRLPIAKLMGETSLMFPVHPTLREEDFEKMTRAIEVIFGSAAKRRLSISA